MELAVINHQPIEKKTQGNQSLLEIVSVFATFQGEGPFTGERAVFVRLAGCNLQCPLCDTDYTSDRRKITYDNLLNEIEYAYSQFHSANKDLFIVLTGGEPLRQNIGPMLRYVIDQRRVLGGIHIQIETNGTLHRDNVPWFCPELSVVCSPKTPKLNFDLIPLIGTYKYVLRAEEMDAEDGLPTGVLGNKTRPARPHLGFRGTVYVQPADEQDETKNKANLEACLYSCKRFGHRLGFQYHKVLGVP